MIKLIKSQLTHYTMNQKRNSRNAAKKQQKTEAQTDPSWEQTIVNLSILYEQNLEGTPIVKQFKLYKNTKGQIVGSFLAETLKRQNLIGPQCTLSFYNFDKNIYVYGFTLSPQVDKQKQKPSKAEFVKEEYEKNIKSSLVRDNTLYVKIRNKKKLVVQALLQEQRIKYDEAQDDKNNKQKEKKIGQVVEKVALWRKFYTGFHDENANYIQRPLQQAAAEVGIAKKTLDDYLLQIRSGKKYGFNFNQKVNSKIGELRAFVRDEKKKEIGGK